MTATRSVPLPAPLDLRGTLWPVAHGTGDPSIRFGAGGVWWALRTPDGAATLHLWHAGTTVETEAWGPGAESVLGEVPTLIGLADDPGALHPVHPLLAEIQRRSLGLRLPRTNRPWEALLPAICEQKVTGVEARAAFRAIVRAHGEPAPGPGSLHLLPPPTTLAALPYFAFHRFGLERRRADTIRRAAAAMARLAVAPPERAGALLAAVPGIGPWTLAEVARVAWGDPDAVSVGDYHLPNLVAWVLAGERRADDARMLELLEPYRGQRGRVQRLLEAGGTYPPRRGPRIAPHAIAGI